MANVYRVKPLHKKSITARYEMYRNNPDGSVSWFNVEELWRWGQAFIEADSPDNLPYKDDKLAYCQNNIGWGCEFDDGISVDFEFSDDLTEEEREHIQDCYTNGDPNDEYERGGAAWLYEGDHDWQFEDDYVIVVAPFQVDLCDDSGDVLEENVELKERPKVVLDRNAAWPFMDAKKEN